MYGCESWMIKKAEHLRTDAFELWCWKRLLRVPWTARRFKQFILKEISPGCSLEGLMLKLKLQYFGHLMWRVDSLEKTLMLGKIEGRKRRGQQRMIWLDGITDSMDMGPFGSWWWTGRPGMLRFMGSQRVGHDWSTELNWTDYQRIHKNNPDAFKCTDLGSNLVLTFFKLYYLVAILYCVLFHASLFLLTANHSPPICAFYKTFSI